MKTKITALIIATLFIPTPAFAVPIPPSVNPTFFNLNQTEDDGLPDAKGIADKTKFIFSVTVTNADTVSLFVDGVNTLNLTKFGNLYIATSTFPKGVHSWYLKAKNWSNIAQTETKTFTVGYSNVAFLPGLEASRLYDVNGNQLWEPLWGHNNSQLYMNTDGTSAVSGIYVGDIIDNSYNIPSKGNIYWSFINKMNEMRNDGTIKNWRAFPYDWRNNIKDVVNNPIPTATGSYSMISEIHRLAETSDTGKVTIIAHSNGGLVAKELTIKLGEETKLLDQMIFVAVPEVGTPSAIGAILHGFQQGLPFDNWLNQIITPSEARTLAVNMPSAYGLLPSENYFTYTDDSVITFDTTSSLLAPWVTKYGSIIHSGERLRNFLADQTRNTLPTNEPLKNPSIGNSTLLAKAEILHAMLDAWAPPVGVEFTEIAGWGEETLKTIEYYQGVQTGCETIAGIRACNFKPILEYRPKMTIDGDGTVVTSSALWTTGAGKYWVNLKSYDDEHPVSTVGGLLGPKHANILEVSQILEFTKNLIIRNKIIPEKYITASSPPSDIINRLAFTLHSPLTLSLTDNLGNHTGISSDGTVEETIPGSRYMTFGEVKYISVPSSAKLHLEMKGYETGSFTLNMEEKQGDTTITQTTFAGVPSNSETIAIMDIPANGGIANASPLTVSDGTTKTILIPKEGEIVFPDILAPKTVTTTTGTIGKNSWYLSDVVVKFTATDEESGVKDTFYSLDKGITWATTTPLIISTEGITTVQFYSTDNAGNKEAVQSFDVKIDKTSPKASISVNPIIKDFKIEGDDISGIATITNTKNTYTITDNAGHTTKLFFEKIFEKKLLVKADLIAVQYDNLKKKNLPESSVWYKWENQKNNEILAEQKIDSDHSFEISAEFDVKKNVTTVTIHTEKKEEDERGKMNEKEPKEQKQKFIGLRVIQLTVDNGTVGYVI